MNEAPETIRVLIVDANVLFRSGIARLLESQPDINVIGEVDDHLAALQVAHELQPDVMLVDIELNESQGATIVRTLKRKLPGVCLVVLRTEIDPDELLECVLAGADGYLLKNITPEELFTRLRG